MKSWHTLVGRLNRLDNWLYVKLNLSEIFESKPLFILFVVLCVATFEYAYKMTWSFGSGKFNQFCWPFWQNCYWIQDIFFLNSHIWLRPIVFTIFGATFFLSFILLRKAKYGLTYLASFFLFFFTVFIVFLLTNYYNYLIHHQEHYHVFAGLIFFFVLRYRHEFLIIFYALSYYISSVAKFTSLDWILGKVLTIYVPDILVPFSTNLITFLQIISLYVLLFADKKYRLLLVIIFESFHIYTFGISIVSYSFFWVTVPFLYLLFVSDFKKVENINFKKSLAGVFILLIFFLLGVWRLYIPGNDYFTREGSGYSLNMFNSAVGCTVFYDDKDMKRVEQSNWEYSSCDTVNILKQAQNACTDEKQRYIKIVLKNKFLSYVLVEEANYCSLNYSVLKHNEWINDRDFSMDIDKAQFDNQRLFLFENRMYIEYFYHLLFIFIGILVLKKFIESERR